MQTNALNNVSQFITQPQTGDAAAKKNQAARAEATSSYVSDDAKDLDASYLKRTNSYAFELNLSEQARHIIAGLNEKARQAYEQNASLAPPTRDGLPRVVNALPAPEEPVAEPETTQRPPTILESFGSNGEQTQTFLRDFFQDGGIEMRRYQDKLGQLIDSMNGGQQLTLIDRMNKRDNPDPSHDVFSMEAPNGSRMRIFMEQQENQSRLTVTYLNRETGSYDLDLFKQSTAEAKAKDTASATEHLAQLKTPASGDAEAEESAQSAPTYPAASEGTIVHVHELGRRMLHGRLNPEPDYNHRETISF